MILEGFEIENWSCIKRVCVDDLPATGIIVLHGPNGTGKSSIIEALRACLMDNKSTSKAIDRGFPKNSTEKPRVSVTFRAGGTTWRITKKFNSKESKLESRTATGQWKLETADPSEAHDRARQMTGGSDSTIGLHQLLWLTQAEFRLPDPKKFDADVQSRLRAVLGVLQTPLDDRFLARVKEGWSRWFGARNKPGEKPKLKKDCPLDKTLAALKQHKAELATVEAEYQAFERMMERSGNLEVLSRDLRWQLDDKTRGHALLQQEYEKSLTRLETHRLATERVATRAKALADKQALLQRRAEAEERVRDAEKAAEEADGTVAESQRRLQDAEGRLRALRDDIQTLGYTGRILQSRLNEVAERRQLQNLKQEVETAQDKLRRVEQTAVDLEELKKQAREHPGPDAATIESLNTNRATAGRLRADLEAAAITLTLIPEAGAAIPRLLIDGAPAMETLTDGMPIKHSIRRRAEIALPGWGRAEITRGSDARSLVQIEDDLKSLDHAFAEALGPFGIAAGDPTALDQLQGLAADKRVRDPEMKRIKEEIERLAPQGLDHLRQEVARLEKTLLASAAPGSPLASDILPTAADDLKRLAEQLKKDIETNEKSTLVLQGQVETVEFEIDGAPDAHSTATKASAKNEKRKSAILGLRQHEAAAKELLATLKTTAEFHRSELARLPTVERIEVAIREAKEAFDQAAGELESANLSDSEATIRQRLDNAAEGLRGLHLQLAEADKEFNQIKGAMRLTEGLHQKRAAIAARVEELTRQTEREALDSEAYDRLYALFEECREKQLGTVMGPIHDRVLRWMRLLRIGGYQSIRFNDQFLPENLIAEDGTMELTLGEESTGTIEQIALMVRLALGSTLSTPENPVVAMLDDPLTHSDVVRLDRMRAVLKSAMIGDPTSNPPGGPLQIVVFTCHPEWFAIDGAKVIDLSKPDTLSRSC